MKKQTRRNYSLLLSGTDFFTNVQRDNARTEYILKLLNETS